MHNPQHPKFLAPIFIFLIGLSLPVWSETYVCVDAQGKKELRDVPCSGRQKTTSVIPDTFSTQKPPANVQGTEKKPANQIQASRFIKDPKSPTIRFFYNPGLEPAGISINQMEQIIEQGLAAWAQECHVHLKYSGIMRKDAPAWQHAEEGYLIRWDGNLDKEYNHGLGAAGVGGPSHGIVLNRNSVKGSDQARRVVVHEIGHVIGIGHIHDDPSSVMSYLSSRQIQYAAKPNASDYLNCNLLISKKYGIKFELPAGSSESKTTDAQAAEILKGNRRY